MSEKTTYTILSGESYKVGATSKAEALAKFLVANGYVDIKAYDGEGFDFSSLADDVAEGETLTEVI